MCGANTHSPGSITFNTPLLCTVSYLSTFKIKGNWHKLNAHRKSDLHVWLHTFPGLSFFFFQKWSTKEKPSHELNMCDNTPSCGIIPLQVHIHRMTLHLTICLMEAHSHSSKKHCFRRWNPPQSFPLYSLALWRRCSCCDLFTASLQPHKRVSLKRALKLPCVIIRSRIVSPPLA